MKIRFYRNQEAAAGGAAAPAAPAAEAGGEANKEEVKGPQSLEELANQPDMTSADFANKTLDDIVPPTPAAAKEEKPAEGAAKPAEGAAAEGEEGGEKPAGQKEEEQPEFKIEPPAAAADEKPEEVATTWKGLAKDLLGKDIAEDDFDIFKKEYDAKVTEERQAGIEEGKKLATKVEASALPEGARDLFEFLSVPGNTVEMFLNPLKEIDEILAMDNEALLRKDFELRKLKPETIDKKIEALREDDAIDSSADELRSILGNAREQRQAKLVIEARQKNEARVKERTETEQREDAAIVAELRKRNKLMGGTLSESAIEKAVQKFTTDYRKRLLVDKEPGLIADAIIYAEYGRVAETELRKNITTGKNIQLRDKLSNTPAIPNAGGAGGQVDTPKGKDGDLFDAWEEGLHGKKS